jgi:hypothetical protein
MGSRFCAEGASASGGESWWVREASDSLGAQGLIVVVPCFAPEAHPFDRMDMSSTIWSGDSLEVHKFFEKRFSVGE